MLRSLVFAGSLILSFTSIAFDFQEIMNGVKNLTEVIGNAESEVHVVTALAQKYYDFLNTHWSTIETSASNIGRLPESIHEALTTVNNVEVDVKAATVVAQKYYEFITTHWTTIETSITNIGRLPDTIQLAVTTLNNALPALETCVYVGGGCLVLSASILAVSNYLAIYKSRQGYIPLHEVVADDD